MTRSEWVEEAADLIGEILGAGRISGKTHDRGVDIMRAHERLDKSEAELDARLDKIAENLRETLRDIRENA